jgi:hypothetical protein
MPGMYPKIVRITQIQNSSPQEYLRNTPKGGNKIASKISTNVAAAMFPKLNPLPPNTRR